jgi:hypothetical protein
VVKYFRNQKFKFPFLLLKQKKTVREGEERRDITEETLWLITVITVSRAGRTKARKKIKEIIHAEEEALVDTCARRNKRSLLLRIAICVKTPPPLVTTSVSSYLPHFSTRIYNLRSAKRTRLTRPFIMLLWYYAASHIEILCHNLCSSPHIVWVIICVKVGSVGI